MPDKERIAVADTRGSEAEPGSASHESTSSEQAGYTYQRADGTVEFAATKTEAIAACPVLGKLALESSQETDLLLELHAIGSQGTTPQESVNQTNEKKQFQLFSDDDRPEKHNPVGNKQQTADTNNEHADGLHTKEQDIITSHIEAPATPSVELQQKTPDSHKESPSPAKSDSSNDGVGEASILAETSESVNELTAMEDKVVEVDAESLAATNQNFKKTSEAANPQPIEPVDSGISAKTPESLNISSEKPPNNKPEDPKPNQEHQQENTERDYSAEQSTSERVTHRTKAPEVKVQPTIDTAHQAEETAMRIEPQPLEGKLAPVTAHKVEARQNSIVHESADIDVLEDIPVSESTEAELGFTESDVDNQDELTESLTTTDDSSGYDFETLDPYVLLPEAQDLISFGDEAHSDEQTKTRYEFDRADYEVVVVETFDELDQLIQVQELDLGDTIDDTGEIAGIDDALTGAVIEDNEQPTYDSTSFEAFVSMIQAEVASDDSSSNAGTLEQSAPGDKLPEEVIAELALMQAAETNEAEWYPEELSAALDAVEYVLREQYWIADTQSLPRRPELSIALTEAIVELFRELGYENPKEAIIGMVSRHGFPFLLEAINTLVKLRQQEYRQEFTTSTQSNNPAINAVRERVAKRLFSYIVNMPHQHRELVPA